MRVVPDVTDVLVFPSFVITELCEVFHCRSDVEFVEPQSFSFSKKRAHCCTDKQDEMRYEGSPVKAHPRKRRRMTPPTPMQNSFSSFVRDHGRYEEEGRGWNAREGTIIARTRQYLERSFSVKVQVEALEALLGPDDVDADLRRILKEARDEQGRRIFETFSSNDMSFLVADRSRWDKYKRAPWRQDSSASARDGWWQACLGQPQEQMIVGWSQDEKRVIDAVEDYLEKCAQVMVKKLIWWKACKGQRTLRSRQGRRKLRGSYIFQLFDTAEKPNHHVASRRRRLESQRRDDARHESGRNEWYDLGYQGAKAKAPPCPNSTLQTPLPQQSSSSARKEEYHWELREERRRRRIAFENLTKGMLRYLDNCNEVKVGITELQARVEVPVQIGIFIEQVAQQAMNEDGQKIFEVFWQEGELFVASWARWEAQRKGFVDLERRCQDISREIQMLNKRQEKFQNAIDGKLRVQGRAGERLQDQIIEEIKELECTKTEEALQIAEKEHDLWMYQNEKEEAKRLQGVRKPRQDEEIAWSTTKTTKKYDETA